MGLEIIIIFLLWVLIWLVVLVLRYRNVVLASWKEPTLSRAVLIFESDDWGPGPADDACQLASIARVLSRHADFEGRHPVMTLGVILAVPEISQIKASAYSSYYRETLGEEKFSSILQEIKNGIEEGVFSAQLHGMEHYWPDNLMKALNASEEVRLLLDIDLPLRTELLPDALQSRWSGGAAHAHSLTQLEIDRAVAEETRTFKCLFSQVPTVIVPPTFVWFERVELSWHSAGLKYLVTPGFIATGRDELGVMGVGKQLIYNGMTSTSGLTYIVRNNYFEPSHGHTVEQAMESLAENTKLGRPTLLETHRFNFCDDEVQSKDSLAKLEQCLERAKSDHPGLCFISTSELGDMYVDPCYDGSLVDRRISSRILVLMARLWACDAIRKWLYISGIFILVKTLSVANTWR